MGGQDAEGGAGVTSEPGAPEPGAPDRLAALEAEAAHWSGLAARAEETVAATRAAIADIRARRSRLIWEQADDRAELSRLLEELSARIDELERAERDQAAGVREVRPRADETAAALAEARERRRRWGELRARRVPVRSTAELHPVSGCLFEVTLPPGRVPSETWHAVDDGSDGDTPPWTLLAVIPPEAAAPPAGTMPEPGTVLWRFRFRAERPGRMTLRFERRDGDGRSTATYWVEVGVAPERLDSDV